MHTLEPIDIAMGYYGYTYICRERERERDGVRSNCTSMVPRRVHR
jgi:hypothetical protein